MKRYFFYSSIPALLLTLTTQTFSQPIENPLFPTLFNSPGNWFITLGAGEQYPQWDNPIKVDTGLAAPHNKDYYSTKNKNEAVVALSLGRRWKREEFWLPAYSFGVFWQYFFRTNLGHCATLYSLPDVTTYSYNWQLTSNLLLASAKLNLFEYGKLSPYVNGGIGSSFNRTSGYKERPLPAVTPRVSPAFGNFSTSEFSYHLGVGLDLQVMPQLIASLGYIYQDLGPTSSGPGKGSWSNQSLNPGSYRSNEVLVSLSYLFGEKNNVK
jgi:opacity protein-like surface antigen